MDINPKILHLRRSQLLALATYQGERIKRLEAKLEAQNKELTLWRENTKLKEEIDRNEKLIEELEDEVAALLPHHLQISTINT